jgi:DNA invertase Pin-like site-specific DNA recombinase
MSVSADQKVTANHLRRDAYLYVRQSTIRQVFENTESTKRQYGLRQRAVALGWPTENVIVIDSDLGQSGASAADREGFQRLVTEVGLGRAGIVLGLEVSRLARNSTDWHRLLEICALTDTLILDEDGLYDPAHFNDRLLLGLKGTMSEAELHVLRGRLRGGIENKARRGELKAPLPIGFIYDEQDRVALEPNRQVQDTIRQFFKTFQEEGSAMATVRHFRKQGWKFPRKLRRGVHKGTIIWGDLVHSRALQLLHNPRYAGAFFFGRSRQRKKGDGHVDFRRLPPDQWQTLLPDAHPGYITWDQYQRNVQQLLENAQALGEDRRKSPPCEGPALLQGLAVCGLCGKRMTVRYDCRETTPVPRYVCQRDGIEQAQPNCQSIPGRSIDEAIGRLLLEKVTPLALEVTLAVQQELQTRLEEADALRKQQVERARYEAELARARFMQVDPRNRLVADALEADWNERLRDLTRAQEVYERHRQQDAAVANDSTRSQVLELATNFPKLWNDPRTSHRDRKRIVRLLIDDVTLIHDGQITAHVRFQGGIVETLHLPRPLSSWELRQTSPQIIETIDRLLDNFTEGQIAEQLNQQGLRSGMGSSFCGRLIGQIRRAHHITCRYERLRNAGMLTQREIAEQLGVHPSTVKKWRNRGLLTAHAYNDKNECLYELHGKPRPIKHHGIRLNDPRRFHSIAPERTDEVQREA